jgi:short-subunit dehydrogenase
MTKQPEPALVTGASSGIGYELAQCFARDGHPLIVAADDDQGLSRAAEALRMAGSPQVEVVPVDLSTPEGAPQLFEQVQQLQIEPGFLVLNAGVGVHGDFLRETDLYAELRMIQLNVTSVVHAAKLFGRSMIGKGEGKILITSSMAAIGPSPKLAVYSGTKAFLHAFAEALRDEIADTGVTVTALMPDATETNFFERAGAADSQMGQAKKADPAQVAQAGYQAMMKGKDHVVTPGGSKIMAAVAKVLPDRLVAHQARAD